MLVIGQLQYATTSRYNFPQMLHGVEIPQRLIELSQKSMHTVKGRFLQPYWTESFESLAETAQESPPVSINSRALSTLITPLTPVRDGTPIIGIDTSTIKIGETEAGIIWAVRAAVVWGNNRGYRYLRLGPLPFHITEENKHAFFGGSVDHTFLNATSFSSVSAETQGRLCNLIERWIQASVSHSVSESIILWDGSLTAGTPGNPVSQISHILEAARKNRNAILAFSKTTTIRSLGWRITDFATRYEPPCLFEVADLPLSTSRRIHLLGRIYAANLSRGGRSFRLDIDRTLSREQGIEAVERLLGNELMFQGYPETLRLAHIYSTFTANDVIGIQSFLKREYGLKIINRRSIRKALFGPYGTRYED